MHTQPMSESEGETTNTEVEQEWCRHCGQYTDFEIKIWESSCGGYEDYKYTCSVCKHGYWVEGPDA